ncbi:hypothetical protein DFR27_0661 [Umboniibacter marinipuniceus]|uniref:Uncharacterized protein n=1 Tax=Umboniibacter marinipuniceus TaxID=569599 RepID=A0A3M0AEW4_9GAMM|nr:hypothetical protein DFR27_0661 [Umboniibacter marinipuniceus]
MTTKCTCNSSGAVSVRIACIECSKVIKKFSIKKPLKTVGLSLAAIYGGSQLIDYAISDNRYPLEIEYAVSNACINSAQARISNLGYETKQRVCLCALEEAMNEISYTRFLVDEDGFLDSLQSKIGECR